MQLKPRLHERFFARAGDAIFSDFVALPARDENRTCSHPQTGDATGEKIARKKSPELKFSRQNRRKSHRVATLQLFARAWDATKEYLANEITGRNRDSGFSKNNNGGQRQNSERKKQSLEVCDSLGFQFVAKLTRICHSCSHPLALGTRRILKKSHHLRKQKIARVAAALTNRHHIRA